LGTRKAAKVGTAAKGVKGTTAKGAQLVAVKVARAADPRGMARVTTTCLSLRDPIKWAGVPATTVKEAKAVREIRRIVHRHPHRPPLPP
jgi:hypothetical protein